jgi:hypothetical protein
MRRFDNDNDGSLQPVEILAIADALGVQMDDAKLEVSSKLRPPVWPVWDHAPAHVAPPPPLRFGVGSAEATRQGWLGVHWHARVDCMAGQLCISQPPHGRELTRVPR